MSSILSTMRQAVAAAIDGIDSVWNESAYTYKAFPGKQPSSLRHKAFVVGVLSSGGDVAGPDKQVDRVGMASRGVVGVKYAWALVSGTVHVDTDAALDASIDIHKALKLISHVEGWQLLHEGTTHTTSVDESKHIGTMLFQVTFRTPLQ